MVEARWRREDGRDKTAQATWYRGDGRGTWWGRDGPDKVALAVPSCLGHIISTKYSVFLAKSFHPPPLTTSPNPTQPLGAEGYFLCGFHLLPKTSSHPANQ